MKRWLLLSLLLAGAARAETPPAIAALPDPELLARAPALPIEDRRQLVHLHARLGQPGMAAALAEQILADHPRDRPTLVLLASMHVEQKDARAVQQIARRLLELFPDDPQGRYYLGAGHLLAEDYAEANRILRELKEAHPAGGRYPYETDLAAAALAAGDWSHAVQSYQELLRHHALSDGLRREVRQNLDGLYREHLPRIEATASQVRLAGSQVRRTSAASGRHVAERHWFEVKVARDDVELAAAPALRALRSTRAEVSGNLATVQTLNVRSDFTLGGSGEGLVAGGRIQFGFAPGRIVAADVTWNERATDSLAFEAIDGRQHRAALTLNWLVRPAISFGGRVMVRRLEAGGSTLGRASSLELNLDQAVHRAHPQVIAGYRGTLARFSPADRATINPAIAAALADPPGDVTAQYGLIDSLISRRINRHGLGVLATDDLNSAWGYRFTAGFDYDVELESTGWNGGLAVIFRPRKSIEVSIEGGYTTSATASNAGSAAALLNFFVRSYY